MRIDFPENYGSGGTGKPMAVVVLAGATAFAVIGGVACVAASR